MKNIMVEVREKVQEMLVDCEVKCEEMMKNNNITLHGIIISAVDSNISPVIYIDKMIAEGLNTEEIANCVVNIYKREQSNQYLDVSNWIYNYENVKDYLTLKLINRNSNGQTLSNIPYKEFLDLAVIVVLSVPFIKDGIGTVKVHHGLVELWKQDFDSIYSQALSNFKKDRTVISSMVEVLEQLCSDNLSDINIPMYILSNDKKLDGAVRMLDEDAIRNFANTLETDLIVIPSSIHELILLPYEEEMDLNVVSVMIHDVNASEVDPMEVLSDHVYLYSREFGWIV